MSFSVKSFSGKHTDTKNNGSVEPALSNGGVSGNQDLVVPSSRSARKARIRTSSSAAQNALSITLTDTDKQLPIIRRRAGILKPGFVRGSPRRCAVGASTVNTNGKPI